MTSPPKLIDPVHIDRAKLMGNSVAGQLPKAIGNQGLSCRWSLFLSPLSVPNYHSGLLSETSTMATVEKTPAIDPEVLADLEAVCNTKGIVRDPKLLRRITERADQVRQETLKQFGVQEIGAEIIRTMHDPE